MKVNMEDLRIETVITGCVTDNFCFMRITHIPTGIVVSDKTDRSRNKLMKSLIKQIEDKIP